MAAPFSRPFLQLTKTLPEMAAPYSSPVLQVMKTLPEMAAPYSRPFLQQFRQKEKRANQRYAEPPSHGAAWQLDWVR